ncbi:MAG: thioredoxin family protein [Candidatus ainarchaeum sp.]|nr:thioredoxin family protein [Candidatus ainarchaeum sp.]
MFDGFFSNPFNRYLAAALIVLGVILFVAGPQAAEEPSTAKLAVHFFYSPTCPHCAAQEPFNEKLALEFTGVEIVKHDVTIAEEYRRLLVMAQNFSLDESRLGTPTTFIGDSVFMGFESENTTGQQMREAVKNCLETGCNRTVSVSGGAMLKDFNIPLLGKADLSAMSLPLLAAVLGLVDGFNPCAMWVLVYLIGLVMDLNDRKRIWLIVGTFLLASGVLYFLFMTAWLNAFLFLGYVRPVTILIGLVALGGGILSIKEYLETHGAMSCKVTGGDEKKKLTARMRELVAAPMTWAVLAGIVVLAFTVNSMEFVCSSAIPAVFTQVLALSGLPAWQYYAYILLYDLFFMLDDLLVFGSAVLVYSEVGGKYAKYCKMIGGAIMLILGLMLLFAPGMLR